MPKRLSRTRQSSSVNCAELIYRQPKQAAPRQQSIRIRTGIDVLPQHRPPLHLKQPQTEPVKDKKAVIRTSYTESADFRIGRWQDYSILKKKRLSQSFLKDETSLQTTEACVSSNNPEMSQGKPQKHQKRVLRKKILFNRSRLQAADYLTNSGTMSFSISKIKSIPRQAPVSQHSVNSFVREQFVPILSYEFSKLSRKDILPELCAAAVRAQMRRAERRMSSTLAANLYSIYPVSYWKGDN